MKNIILLLHIYALFNVSYTLIGMEQEVNRALHKASLEGDCVQCMHLIEQGADVCWSNEKGNSPLHVAANESIISLLCTFKADINQRNHYGETPLLYQLYTKKLQESTFEQQQRKINISYLLNLGVNPNDRIESSGRTALHLACMYSGAEIIKLLLDAGANPAVCSNSGLLPIEFLAKCVVSHLELFEPYGYTVFSKSSDPFEDLYDLLKQDATFLKKIVDGYKLGDKTKILLYRLFIALHEWDDLDETKKQQAMIKKNSSLGIICRYPSYALLEGFFGVNTIVYAKEALKTKIIGDYLFNLFMEYGMYTKLAFNAVEEEMRQPIHVSHNNKDLFVSTYDDSKDYFAYACRSYKYWRILIQLKMLEYFLISI